MDASEVLAVANIVPVITLSKIEQAEPLAECLYASGMPCIEITLRSDIAIAAIERVAKSLPKVIVGAGSVRTAQQMQQVFDAGAKFAVSPGSSSLLLSKARELALPFVPGTSTPSEMIALLDQGYRLQKFFPAEQVGGLAYLKAVAKPLPEIRFFPTGGIDAELAAKYLAFDAVACIGGSWFICAEKLAADDYQSIANSARQLLSSLSIRI